MRRSSTIAATIESSGNIYQDTHQYVHVMEEEHAKRAEAKCGTYRLKDRNKLENLLVKQCYEKLETARKSLLDFAAQTKTKVSLRHLEEKWGEYYVANELVKNGISIAGKIGPNKGSDITAINGVRIEVKTSRRVPRFKGAKKGYSWLVKDRQWKDKEFDYLVCVTADEEQPRTLAFTFGEVVKNFTLCSFIFRPDASSSGSLCKDYRLLDLIDGGEKGLEINRERALTVLEFRGQTTPFEAALNQNRDTYFEKYNLKRIMEQIRSGKALTRDLRLLEEANTGPLKNDNSTAR
jgi:hypothetical protein